MQIMYAAGIMQLTALL